MTMSTHFISLCCLSDIPSAPGRPTVSAQSNTSALIKWTPPTKDGGSVITHYVIEYRMEGFHHWREEKTTGTYLSHTVQNLTKGSTYTFRVRAVNVAGDGPASDESVPTRILPTGCQSPILTNHNQL